MRLGSLTQEVDALRQVVQQIGVAPVGDQRRRPAGGRRRRRRAPPRRRPRAARRRRRVAAEAVATRRIRDYTAGQYDLAIVGFEAFIKAFPEVRSGRRRAGAHRQRVPAGRQERARPSKRATSRSATTRTATRFPTRTIGRASRCRTSKNVDRRARGVGDRRQDVSRTAPPASARRKQASARRCSKRRLR